MQACPQAGDELQAASRWSSVLPPVGRAGTVAACGAASQGIAYILHGRAAKSATSAGTSSERTTNKSISTPPTASRKPSLPAQRETVISRRTGEDGRIARESALRLGASPVEVSG
jgi:hypothetical protein